MKLRIFIIQILLLVAFPGQAQEIDGTIKDPKKEPIVNVTVKVFQGSVLKGGAVSDYDGNYQVKPLDPGQYEVTISYPGKQTITYTTVPVDPGEKTTLNITMESWIHDSAITRVFKRWLLHPHSNLPSEGSDPFNKMDHGGGQVSDLVSVTPNLYQPTRGKPACSGNPHEGAVAVTPLGSKQVKNGEPVKPVQQKLNGAIFDTKNKLIPNASVKASQGGVLKAESVPKFPPGTYWITLPDTGSYDITVSSPGKQTVIYKAVSLDLSQKKMFDITLGKRLHDSAITKVFVRPVTYPWPVPRHVRDASRPTQCYGAGDYIDLVELKPGIYQSARRDPVSDSNLSKGAITATDSAKVKKEAPVKAANHKFHLWPFGRRH